MELIAEIHVQVHELKTKVSGNSWEAVALTIGDEHRYGVGHGSTPQEAMKEACNKLIDLRR